MHGRASLAVLFGFAASLARAGTPLRYQFVPARSDLHFELPTTFHTVEGRVVTWKGGFELDPGNPEKSSGGLSIEAASIVTGNARRDRVMRERVLETGKFPLITFAVDKLSGDWSHFQPGQTLTAELSGRLTIHGVTQPVELSVQCTVLPDGVLVAGGLPVHWHDFGLWNPSNFFNKVRDPMMVVFRLRGVPGQPENP